MQRRIDPSSERPKYRQLADIIRQAITGGTYGPGHSLPPEADLCDTYDLSLATVRKALAILRAEGLIEPVPSKPWRVRERGEPAVVHVRRGRVEARLATREDHERFGVPEGVVILVVTRPGEATRAYQASECVVDVDALAGDD